MLSYTRKTARAFPKIVTGFLDRHTILNIDAFNNRITVIKMNKTVLTSFTILCLLSIVFLIGYKISAKASPDVIHVPTDFPTIQEAINHATDGDTIFVHNGTYYEHVILNKSVSLVGEYKDSTTIDGNETGSVISITANNVNINGFTIQNSGPTDPDSGIYIISSGNNISHNTIANNLYGINLYYSSNNVISGNNIYSNNNDGINLYYSSNNVISGNNVYSNYKGINLYQSSNNVISDNNASNNDCGIWICQLSSNNVISGNNVYSNNDGINLYYSSNNVISGNNVYSNYKGIYLYYSSNSVISGNNVYSNNDGIYLYYSSNDNTIYHNNFLNNIGQVWSDSLNVWDNGHEGNYWSNYTEQDLNEDGIGDTPYAIDVNNRDNHPLMGMFSDFKVTWKQETHHVTTICNSTISGFRFEVGTEIGSKIISFNVTGKDGTVGFCRVMTPTDLMNYPFIVLVDEEETIPTLLNVSDKTHAYLYFTYTHSSHTITIISSKLLYIYNELLDKYAKLQIDFNNLNSTYHELLNNQSTLLDNYSQLLESYSALNTSYQEWLQDYSELQANYASLLLEHTQNIRNLTYVFIATTIIFIIAAAYLSTHAHSKVSRS